MGVYSILEWEELIDTTDGSGHEYANDVVKCLEWVTN